MNRNMATAVVSHVRGAHVRPVLFVDLDYPEGPVRVCSFDHALPLDGSTYLGVGLLGSVGAVQEGTDAQSYGIQLSLSGVPGQYGVGLARQSVQGREARIRLGFVNAGHQLIGPPTAIFVGRMDTQDISVGESTSVRVACESLLIDWERNCSRRYTHVDQTARYPDDRGLEYVAATVNAEFVWGR